MPNSQRWAAVQSLLHWPDHTSLDIIYAVAMHTKFPGDPLWMLLIGPSSSGKTAIIETFFGHYLARPMDEISTKGFVTGADNKVEYLRTLDQGLLLIKELTVLLSQSTETAEQIFAQLRAIYDGTFVKVTGLGIKNITSRFGMLAGCVPQIDVYTRLNASMGDRFLRVEWPVDRDELIRKSRSNSGHDGMVRQMLQHFSHTLLDRSVDMMEQAWLPYVHAALPKSFEMLIDEMASVMGFLRAGVMRDRMHKVQAPPSIDGGARLAKLLTELVRSLLFLYEEPLPSLEVIEALRRVCYSMIPRVRRGMIDYLLAVDQATVQEISASMRIPASTLREDLEDAWMAGIIDIERASDHNRYRLRPEIRSQLTLTGIPVTLEAANSQNEPDQDGW